MPAITSYNFLNWLILKIEVQLLIYNIVLVSLVQQSDSVIHMYAFVFMFFSIVVYQDIKYTSMCLTGPFSLSVLFTVVCIYLSQTPNLSLPCASSNF